MRLKYLFVLPLLAVSLISCNQTSSTEPTTQKEDTYFNITIETPVNGTITCDKERVKQGDIVTFTFSGNEGYEIEKFVVNNEEKPIELGHYTVINVQQDLAVSATFVKSDIVVRYLVDDVVIQTRKVKSGADASYVGADPKRDIVGGKIYAFSGWSLTRDGDLIDSFIFTKSTDIYGVFSEMHYTISMAESLNINTLHKGDLELVTDYPESIVKEALNIEDPTICSVDANYKVNALKSGTTTIDFKIGDTVIKSCQVTVTNLDNVIVKKCYPAATGSVTYNDNNSVGRFSACQTLLTDMSNNNIDEKAIDFEGDFMFSSDITASENFGIQVNKEINNVGNVTKCFQFGMFTGTTNNILLKVSGTTRVTASHELTSGVVYHFRVVTTEISTGVNVKCYIDGTKVIDSNRGDLGGATNYIGFRYANSNNNYVTFSNLRVS